MSAVSVAEMCHQILQAQHNSHLAAFEGGPLRAGYGCGCKHTQQKPFQNVLFANVTVTQFFLRSNNIILAARIVLVASAGRNERQFVAICALKRRRRCRGLPAQAGSGRMIRLALGVYQL